MFLPSQRPHDWAQGCEEEEQLRPPEHHPSSWAGRSGFTEESAVPHLLEEKGLSPEVSAFVTFCSFSDLCSPHGSFMTPGPEQRKPAVKHGGGGVLMWDLLWRLCDAEAQTGSPWEPGSEPGKTNILQSQNIGLLTESMMNITHVALETSFCCPWSFRRWWPAAVSLCGDKKTIIRSSLHWGECVVVVQAPPLWVALMRLNLLTRPNQPIMKGWGDSDLIKGRKIKLTSRNWWRPPRLLARKISAALTEGHRKTPSRFRMEMLPANGGGGGR